MENTDFNLWQTIRNEAEQSAAEEPMLASFLHMTVLRHDSLERVLAFHLSSKLANPTMDMRTLYELYLHALEKEPSIGEAVRADITAYYERDPACDQYCLPLLYFKGYHAIQAHRINHCLWKEGRKTLAYFLQNRASEVFGVDIHPAARFGQRHFHPSRRNPRRFGQRGRRPPPENRRRRDDRRERFRVGQHPRERMRENRRGQRGGGGSARLQHRRRRTRPRGRQQIACQTGGGNESEFL